jgi:acetate---CoA ligase (ADP-forming)
MKTALHALLAVRSIAVIGASTNPHKVGHQVFRNLHVNNPKGTLKKTLYPINPDAEPVLDYKAYGKIGEIRKAIDLVVIVTPAPTVVALIDEIIERNRHLEKEDQVKGVIIITAGFAEISEEGKQVQNTIATKLALANIQLLGPNTLGCLQPSTGLNASFAQEHIPVGNIALISQSGAMMTALFNAIEQRGVGVSFAVSLGNKAGITENECLEYALQDTDTQVVVAYIESFQNLPKFFEIVSKLSKKKPVLLLKGGTSQRGQQASASHTAALATNNVLLTAAAEQMGFIMVHNLEELTNLAFFFAEHRQAPENIMVLTNAGGPAVNTIDLLSEASVPLAKWSPTSLTHLKDKLPGVTPHNPFDLLGDASPDRFELAIQTAQRDLNVDGMVVIITPQAVTDIPGTIETILKNKGKKPIFVALVGGDQLEKYRQKLRQHHVFCTPFPNDITAMLQYMKCIVASKYDKHTFVSSEAHTPTQPKIHKKKKSAGFNIQTAFELLKDAGMSVPKFAVISRNDMGEFESLKYPLFVKTANLSITHKKEVGAVYGVVRTPEEAQKAYQEMAKFGPDVLYQELLAIEHEILVGIAKDAQFGLYLTVGLGGSYTNILADREYIFLPTTKDELAEVWQRTKAAEVVKEIPKISTAVVTSLNQLQKVVMKHTEIREIEINPLVINDRGVWATDIKVSV